MHTDFSPEALRQRWDGPVRSVAGWSQYRNYDFDDLVQAGHQGVLHARWRYVESAEPPPKLPFKKAAWWYIRNAIERAAAKQRPRLRRARIDEARHAAAQEQIEQYTANGTDHDFVGGAADLIGQLAAAALVEVYVDPDLFTKDEPTPDELADHHRARTRVAAAVGFLDKSEREVVEARYLDDLTFEQIAVQLNLGERWVRQLHQRALRRIKENMAEQQSDQRRVY